MSLDEVKVLLETSTDIQACEEALSTLSGKELHTLADYFTVEPFKKNKQNYRESLLNATVRAKRSSMLIRNLKVD